MSIAPISKLFIVTSLLGLEEDTMHACVAMEKGERQTKYWPYGSLHTPPILEPNASVVPIHIGEKVAYRAGGWS